ncbi:hypothetical protein HF072_07350 [Bacillus sp. RO3]|nr:hypothetical protein [Bacillus sp. RO3]
MAGKSVSQLKINVDVEGPVKGLKALQRELKETIKLHKELESHSNSKFGIGESVLCFWAGKVREGLVVDPYVNYNHALEFSAEHCEPACIIRFEGQHNKETHYGHPLGLHEVIPHREIKRLANN